MTDHTDSEGLLERTAQISAHRVITSPEHAPWNGLAHGDCIVCRIPWPCEYAGKPPAKAHLDNSKEESKAAMEKKVLWLLEKLESEYHGYECPADEISDPSRKMEVCNCWKSWISSLRATLFDYGFRCSIHPVTPLTPATDGG